jgi:antitoxin (DNA-binding transcriptional repressor) of toxin-antitoxin stability system
MVAEPMLRQVDLETLDEPLERVIERAAEAHERIVLRRGGMALALVVPANDRDRRDASSWEEDLAMLAEASRRFADVPIDELETRVAEAVAEVRLQRWRERHPDQ